MGWRCECAPAPHSMPAAPAPPAPPRRPRRAAPRPRGRQAARPSPPARPTHGRVRPGSEPPHPHVHTWERGVEVQWAQ
eukprot:8051-Chlamydomonas_euryale.AAC.1